MTADHIDDPDERARNLRCAIHAFVRRFGLLEPSRTPCGQPLPVIHAHTLMELLDSPGMTHRDLVIRLALSKSTVSRMVARLEEQGRLAQQRDAEDRRMVRLRLTTKGRRLAERINAQSLNRFAEMVERLPEKTLTTVMESLDCLTLVTSKPDKLEDEVSDA